MRKVLSFLVIVALLFTSIAVLPPNQSYAADPTQTVTKYHLDMGIWVANPSELGSSKTYTANLTFNNDIKIQRVMSIEDAIAEGIAVFDETVCTNNLSNYFSPDPEEAYELTYAPYKSSSITNRKPKVAEGKNVSYIANVKLATSPDKYNLRDIYKSHYNLLQDVKQTTWVPDPVALKRVRELQSEIDELSAKIVRYTELGNTAASKGQEYAARFYRSCVSDYKAKRTKLQTIKNSIKTGNERETITSLYQLDTEGFIDDTFKFWGAGGIEVGSGYAYLKSAAPGERNVGSEYSIFTAINAIAVSIEYINRERRLLY